MAAMGRQLKQSVKVFHSLMLYRLLPAQKETAQREGHPPHKTQSSVLCTQPGYFVGHSDKAGRKAWKARKAYILLCALPSSTLQNSDTSAHKSLTLSGPTSMPVPALVP